VDVREAVGEAEAEMQQRRGRRVGQVQCLLHAPGGPFRNLQRHLCSVFFRRGTGTHFPICPVFSGTFRCRGRLCRRAPIADQSSERQ
jgi:hypothetical protein